MMGEIPLDGVLIIQKASGLSLFEKIENINTALFSGFLTTIRSFVKEMSLLSLLRKISPFKKFTV